MPPKRALIAIAVFLTLIARIIIEACYLPKSALLKHLGISKLEGETFQEGKDDDHDVPVKLNPFRDIELSGDNILGKGKYTVTWILEDSMWKIQCHTWSIPEKESNK